MDSSPIGKVLSVIAALAVATPGWATAAGCPKKYLDLGSRNLAVATGQNVVALTADALLPADNAVDEYGKSEHTFYYIVPATQYASGAVIVKARHKGTPEEGAADSGKIEVSRPAYARTCMSIGDEEARARYARAFYAAYDRMIDVQEFEDYYDLGKLPVADVRNTEIDRSRAELGDRVLHFVFNQRTACATTEYPLVRSMLFRDVPAGKSFIAGIQQVLAAAFDVFSQPRVSQAAALPEYSGYLGLSSTIIPYTKKPDEQTCVSFTLRTPAGAKWIDTSQVMILDEDDALIATGYTKPKTDDEFYVGFSPQRSWTIQWRQQN